MHIEKTAEQCPGCGAAVAPLPEGAVLAVDPLDTRICDLLTRARLCQQAGDLPDALRFAREALSLRPNCSTIHALLGQLSEQIGDESGARQHFQAALEVSPSDALKCPQAFIPPVPILTAPSSAAWRSWVLIGCVLISGLAILCSFWPFGAREERSTLLPIPSGSAPELTPPRWTWIAPPQAPQVVPAPVPTPDPLTQPPPEVPIVVTPNTPATDEPDTIRPVSILGPSIRDSLPTDPTKPASLDDADKAFFRGQFRRAVTIYEDLLRRDEPPTPHLFQNLAWCYQQGFGDSQRATEYLEKAVQGYKAQLATNAQDAAAQQGLQTCTAALESLRNSREQQPNP